jgi:SulP family sulfate permease
LTHETGVLRAWGRKLPLARSLGDYGRPELSTDVAAGLTVGVVLIPQGMAYALIAGLPPVFGLYAAVVPMALYALFGTSRHMSVGPVAMAALLVASGVGPLAGGDPARYITLAVLLSGLIGIVQLLMGLFRAGFLVNLLSHPVLAGFTSAAAIMIAASQLGGLTGLAIESEHVHEVLLEVANGWRSTHMLTLAVGLSAIVGGVGLRRLFPRLPVPMIIVVAGTLASWVLGFGDRGVQIVGAVPSGLPAPAVPGFSIPGLASLGASLSLADAVALMPAALAISLVGFMESIAVAKVYASRYRYDIDADQELKALGVANIAGAFFQSFPVTGGFSRTAVNVDAGAKSQISALVSVGVIAVTLLFLTPLFHHLPKAILAAIIVVAVAGLVDVRGARALWRIDRKDFALMLATFVATLALGIEEGILVGVALSVAVVLEQITRPHIAVLGRIPGTDRYRNVRNQPDAIVEPGVAVLRMDASLFYGNAEAFRDAARECFRTARAASPIRDDTGEPGGAGGPDDAGAPDRRAVLVIDAYPINRTDSTGLHMLHEIAHEVLAQGGRVYVSGVKKPLHEKLVAGGVTDLIGPEHLFPELSPAVDAASAWVRGEPAPVVTNVRTPAAS